MTDGGSQVNPAEQRRRIPLADMVAEEARPAQAGSARLIISAKIAILAALLYAAYLVIMCPCEHLLECKDHMFQFSAALLLSVGAVVADQVR